MITKKVNLNESSLGIELGSTRIKAVLIDCNYNVIETGVHDWENQFENGYWTYPLESVWKGIQGAVAQLMEKFKNTYGESMEHVGAVGISAMMHGYLPFDKDGNQLTEFRTWRNTTTGQAAEILTQQFQFNIPQRWSIAHLYQAILNQEDHLVKLAKVNTLAGYVHEQLTEEFVVGVGEASGIFPIDSTCCDYQQKMVEKFDAVLSQSCVNKTLRDLLPRVLKSGEDAGVLTEKGARLLDPTGVLKAGALMCPPEGDAGTGMVATNSVKVGTGNVSAGTSIFAMIVLEKELSKVYPEIDMVTTPAGDPVAMVHCNTCSSDLDAWVKVFGEMIQAAGTNMTKPQVYDLFYQKALEGDADCGGLVNFNYYAGEPVTGLDDGCPMLLRRADAKLTLANLARVQLYSAMATLKLGMDILLKSEAVTVNTLVGHGGLFKTPLVSQKLMAGALSIPVMVQETAGEGGAWGIAVLAAYRKNRVNEETLDQYLEERVFKAQKNTVCQPDLEDTEGFSKFIKRYSACINVEKEAVKALVK